MQVRILRKNEQNEANPSMRVEDGQLVKAVTLKVNIGPWSILVCQVQPLEVIIEKWQKWPLYFSIIHFWSLNC